MAASGFSAHCPRRFTSSFLNARHAFLEWAFRGPIKPSRGVQASPASLPPDPAHEPPPREGAAEARPRYCGKARPRGRAGPTANATPSASRPVRTLRLRPPSRCTSHPWVHRPSRRTHTRSLPSSRRITRGPSCLIQSRSSRSLPGSAGLEGFLSSQLCATSCWRSPAPRWATGCTSDERYVAEGPGQTRCSGDTTVGGGGRLLPRGPAHTCLTRASGPTP